jgi:mono/diheme cytochrome c family protein
MRLVWTAAVVAALASYACGGGTADTGEGALALTGDVDRGRGLFETTCAPCHGSDGSGGSQGVDLREHVPEHSDRELVRVMARGEDRMPDPGLASDQEIADVLAYLRATFTE